MQHGPHWVVSAYYIVCPVELLMRGKVQGPLRWMAKTSPGIKEDWDISLQAHVTKTLGGGSLPRTKDKSGKSLLVWLACCFR